MHSGPEKALSFLMGVEEERITGDFATQLCTTLCEELQKCWPRGVPKPVFDAADVQCALCLWQHSGRPEVTFSSDVS